MAGGRLPVASGAATVRALTRAGFVVDRIAGSHHVLVYVSHPKRGQIDLRDVHMHGTASKRQRNARSAISNGSRLFAARLDLRTPRGKRFRDLIDAYTHDAGDDLTEAQRAMVRDLAMLQVLSEDLQQKYMETGVMGQEDQTQYARVTNNMRRHMKTLGLTTKKASADDDDVEDPLEYARRGGSRRKARLYPELLEDKLNELVDMMPKPKFSMTPADKSKRLKEIRQELDEAERYEVALIDDAADQGIVIEHRPNVDIPALLATVMVKKGKKAA